MWFAYRQKLVSAATESAVGAALQSVPAPLPSLTPTLSLLSFSWAGKQRSTRKYIFPVLKIRIICSFFNAMTRATKKIVAEWIALEDQDDDENDEEEVNDEDGGGQNFGVSEVYELF